jgi:hypothetical protein
MMMTVVLVVIVLIKTIVKDGGYNVPRSKGVTCTIHDSPQKTTPPVYCNAVY